tara:strand:+ start:11775 stop:12152 length:378 start_codon:yes stop_codon:yes gene_type:complete
MLKDILALLKDKILIIAIIVTVSILYLSLMRMPKYNIAISHIDKWQHCIAYFTLSISWLLTFYKQNKKYLVVISCILFGIIIEILQQTITSYRTGDYLDIIANSVGVLLGLLFFTVFFKKNEVKK